jgi:hypothetical protein
MLPRNPRIRQVNLAVRLSAYIDWALRETEFFGLAFAFFYNQTHSLLTTFGTIALTLLCKNRRILSSKQSPNIKHNSRAEFVLLQLLNILHKLSDNWTVIYGPDVGNTAGL